MMDSQDNALVGAQPIQEQPTTAAEPTPQEEAQVENAAAEPARIVYHSKEEVLQRVREIAHGEEVPQKEEVEHLKTVFYKLQAQEREAKLKEHLENGGTPESYQIAPDDVEEAFKAEMVIVRERRQQQFRENEAEKAKNLARKLEIIEAIKTIITSPEEVGRHYQELKALQQEWKEIRNIPAEKVSELWRTYQHYVEQFYDLLKLNSEAREYDFKKNLETKTRLCEAAEKLAEEEDVVSAFHALQKLHQEYRETGPVSKELREELWQRFKAASTIINKRHQQHFESLRAQEEENLAKKTALCERVEAILNEEHKKATDWEQHTQEIVALQTEWKTIGFAPQKMNVKIFERFRTACDQFFTAKAAHFRSLKEGYRQNAERKRALIEQARALQDSTEWRATGEKLIALQKEWKTIGTVPKRLGDQLWEEFLAACNKFFEARKAAGADTRGDEHRNLEQKRQIIAKLKEILETKGEEAGDGVQEQIHQLIEEYQAIGHVPFREKDKLNAEYRELIDRIQKEQGISVARRRLSKFRDGLRQIAERGEGALENERARLLRQYEALKQEVQTYENNLGFLTVSSKKGSSLLDEMQRRAQKLRDEMQLVLEKVKAIDAENTTE